MSIAEAERPTGWLGRFARLPQTLLFGMILSLTVGTSILLLGWQMGIVRTRAMRLLGLETESNPPFFGAPLTRGIRAALRAFAGHIRRGFYAALALGIATFPFAVFWMVSWWAGWENSFNKGYEQAFVGPLLGLSGIAVFALTLVYLPMALAHQAVEDRAFALFELRRVKSVVMHAGWRYSAWAFFAVVLALPLFAARGLPVFAEGIYPGFAELTSEEVIEVRMWIGIATAAYVFVATTWLRWWSASIYARATARAVVRDAQMWAGAVAASSRSAGVSGPPWRLTRWFHGVALFTAWSAVAVLIFIGQFLNHEWHVWLTHPLVFLPWGW